MNVVAMFPVKNAADHPLRGEADHRIANSLAVISGLVRIKASKGVLDADDARAFLVDIAGRIETVSKLHRLVAHSDAGTVNLAVYLDDICDTLTSALAPEATSVSFACARETVVPYSIALPIGLITAELFSNSMKYAHPAGLPVKIRLSCDGAPDGSLIVAYEDDGVGFPVGFDPRTSGNLGMRFIRSLCEQVGGMHRWMSDELGIRFELHLPASVLEK